MKETHIAQIEAIGRYYTWEDFLEVLQKGVEECRDGWDKSSEKWEDLDRVVDTIKDIRNEN